ncbi:hypothetical protein HCJ55_13415, partial [Listeria marthii]|nr:hypothetical protein [Listeria marthii]
EEGELLKATLESLKQNKDPITGQEISKAQSFGILTSLVFYYKAGRYRGKKLIISNRELEVWNNKNRFIKIPKLRWKGKNFSEIGATYTPVEFITQLEHQGWIKVIEKGGSKSGPATILTNPISGEKVRIHALPSNEKPYFRVQNKGGNYLDDTGQFPSNATKQELRDLTHFYFN